MGKVIEENGICRLVYCDDGDIECYEIKDLVR